MMFNWSRTKRVLAVIVVLLCILPSIVRLLKLLFPPPVQDSDIYHLARLLFDKQNFPVNHESSIGDNTSITIKVNKQIIKTHLLTFGHVLDDKKKYDNDSVLKYFMPTLSLNDREILLVTTETFVRTCEMAHLTYFLWGGSLLGAYRHHGLIPWDDDVDVIMNASDWRKIQNVFSRIEGYTLLVSKNVHWKFFKTELPHIKGEMYKWPFIDIIFVKEDSTHLWALSGTVKKELLLGRQEIFPLQLRQFEHLRVAVPCNMEGIAFRQFVIRECHSPNGSHKYNIGFNSSRIKRIPCKALYNIFPFVFRQKNVDSRIVETLKIGNIVLRNITVPQSCKQNT